jgi:Ran GTPase-activating protein (RanGAP) involved in mRNA processing and transport
MENSTLRVLDLSCNEIAVEGAQAIAKYLTGECCALESLHLSANRIVDLGAKAIAQALAQNQTLLHIDMTHNNITDDGLSRLAESLFHNKTLLSFKLYGNHFGQGCLQLYHKLFQTERENEWYPDFNTYIVDDEVQMAYVETTAPYDIMV